MQDCDRILKFAATVPHPLLQAGKQRASRGSQDLEAKRAAQAEQSYLRGHGLRKQGKLPEASKAFSEALVLAPDHFKALFNQAFVLDRVSALAKWGGWAAEMLVHCELVRLQLHTLACVSQQ